MSGCSDFNFEKVGGSRPFLRALRTLYSMNLLMALVSPAAATNALIFSMAASSSSFLTFTDGASTSKAAKARAAGGVYALWPAETMDSTSLSLST